MLRLSKTMLTLIALVAVLLVVTFYCVWAARLPRAEQDLQDAGIVLLAQSRPLPDLHMLDQDARIRTSDTFAGHWTLMLFGYTACPDICPITLAQIRQVLVQMTVAQRQQLRVVMVTLDPEHDSPAVLKSYLANFDPQFEGWVVSSAQLATLAQTLGISKDLQAHSGNVQIIGPDGKQRGLIRAPLEAQRLIQQLPLLIQRP